MKNNGFKNEKKLIKKLNNQYFSDLNPNLKQLISQSFTNHQGLITCQLEAGNNKSDIKIQIAQESHTYSVKMGKGNSIHQEPLEGFIYFLKEKQQLPTEIEAHLQSFIWGDGTVDGSGEIKSRISARKFKKQYPQKIEALKHYFEKIKKPLIRRFLIEGVKSHSSAEFIYYGTVKKGTVCRTEEVLNWVSKQKAKGILPIGRLTLQAWNRNLKGKKRSEKKRGIIQLKWSSIRRDLKKIAHINLGKLQEIEFVKMLNQKEQLSYWGQLNIEDEGHFAIRVKYQKFSKINQRKVWAKADAFIAKGAVPENYLRLNEYFLDEDDVKKFQLLPLSGTGISIKQINSTQYQIAKMSPSTFEKVFGSNILAAGASLYYQKKKKLKFNTNILKRWKITEEAFFDYYSKTLSLHINSVTDSRCQKCLKKIKRYANAEIAKKINEEKKISDYLFFGIGNFEEPFTAPWLFEHGSFKRNYLLAFSVTTGSGRSRGKCTIVLKPKKLG